MRRTDTGFFALRDQRTQSILDVRIARLRLGLFGQCRFVGAGVLELKIDFGPGYRVYFALARKNLILLLLGGDKSTQRQDVHKAQAYWLDYRRRNP